MRKLILAFIFAPFLIVAASLKEQLALEPNQRIVFAGDSISNAHKWTNYMIAWFHLTYPELDLSLQEVARSGTSTEGWYLSPDYQGSEIDGSEYERYVYPLDPDIVFLMLGHNDGSDSVAMKSATESLITEWIEGTSNATPVLIGCHPTESSDGKPALARFNDNYEEIALTAPTPYLYAKTWYELVDRWTSNYNDGNPIIDLESVDSVHPGFPGHIAIAYAVLKQLGAETLVSSAHLNAADSTIVASDDCTISNLSLTPSGGTFDRLDQRLPWAIDEQGREKATALIPEIENWQTYSIQISGLAEGNYTIKCDGVTIGTTTSSELQEGWNMASLTLGPVWEQCQEVLGCVRDMQGIDRTTQERLGPPWQGFEAFKSATTAYYQNGDERGETYFDHITPRLQALPELDSRIHEAATPIKRTYTIEPTDGNSEPDPAAEQSPGNPHENTAYSLPIGIPDTDWGTLHPIRTPTPTVPEVWEGVIEGYYYVDHDHALASDTDNSNGTPSNPRSTIPEKLSAGDIVFVESIGSLTSLTSLTGTEENPIWIIGTGAALIRPEQVGTYLYITYSEYLFIDGLNIDGTNTPDTQTSVAFGIDDGSHHVTIRNCSVRNMQVGYYNPDRFSSGGAAAWYSGISSISPRNADVSQIVLYNVDMSNNAGGQDLDYENGRHCLISAGDSDGKYSVSNVWILNCTFANNPEDAIQLGSSSNSADNSLCRRFFIGGNTFSNNGENAIDLKACTDVVASENRIFGYKSTNYREGAVSGSDGTAIVLNDDGGGPGETWWLFNTISDARSAFRNQASSGNHYLIGNVIFDLNKSQEDPEPTSAGKAGGVAYFQSAKGPSVTFVNNTIYNVHGGIYLNNVNSATFKGNIISEIRENTLGWTINVNNYLGEITTKNNIHYDSDGPIRADSDVIGIDDLFDVSPMLTRPELGDFHPTPTSPAINSVSIPEEYNLFHTKYGIDIKFTKDGFARPTLTKWSAGAYEIKILGVGTSPIPPSALTTQ